MQITITKYDELRQYRDAFAGKNPLDLIFVGRAGLGKSRALTGSLGVDTREFVLIRGRVSALRAYCKMAEYRDLPIVVDDTDDALTSSPMRNLLKEMSEHELIKTGTWDTATTRLVDSSGKTLPRSFTTIAPLCVIANDLGQIRGQLAALASRSVIITLAPDIYEVHRYVGQWFTDPAIYEFVGENLPLILRPDCRDYVNARKIKENGMDWKDALRQQWDCDARLLPVAKIMADPAFCNTQERVAAYQALTGGSRRTFMYLQAELRELRGTDQSIAPLDLKLSTSA